MRSNMNRLNIHSNAKISCIEYKDRAHNSNIFGGLWGLECNTKPLVSLGSDMWASHLRRLEGGTIFGL
jgi:hypothetical protein